MTLSLWVLLISNNSTSIIQIKSAYNDRLFPKIRLACFVWCNFFISIVHFYLWFKCKFFKKINLQYIYAGTEYANNLQWKFLLDGEQFRDQKDI